MENTEEAAGGADILAAFRVEAKTLDVVLPKGHVIKARSLPDYAEWVSLRRYVNTQKSLFLSVEVATNHYPDCAPFLPVLPEVLNSCLWCEALITEPRRPLAYWLEVAKTCGTLLDDIMAGLLPVLRQNMATAERANIEEAKEKLLRYTEEEMWLAVTAKEVYGVWWESMTPEQLEDCRNLIALVQLEREANAQETGAD